LLDKTMDTLRVNLWVQTVCAVLLTTAVLAIAMNFPNPEPFLKFDKNVQIGIFATVPLFVVTVIQVRSAVKLQRAAFIKEYVTKLHTDRDLSEAFHYLVYTYSDPVLDKFLRADPQVREEMQKGRPVGGRLYDPSTFQLSEEERRLDGILGYFDVLGYHYVAGTVSLRDVANVLGFQLAALSRRKVVRDYLNAIPDYWKKFEGDDPQAVAPFRYLTVLLTDFRKYNKQHSEWIEKINRATLRV
jgi:hypothetical protein